MKSQSAPPGTVCGPGNHVPGVGRAGRCPLQPGQPAPVVAEVAWAGHIWPDEQAAPPRALPAPSHSLMLYFKLSFAGALLMLSNLMVHLSNQALGIKCNNCQDLALGISGLQTDKACSSQMLAMRSVRLISKIAVRMLIFPRTAQGGKDGALKCALHGKACRSLQAATWSFCV